MIAVILGKPPCGIAVEDGSWCPVLFRSTGLGRTELVGEIVAVKAQGDYLVMEVHTSEPVRWKIRGALSLRDLSALLKAALRPSVLSFFLKWVGGWREPKHPGDF